MVKYYWTLFEKALKSGQFSKSGYEYVIRCPFCDDDKGSHYINIYKKVSYCFKMACHASVAFKSIFVGHSVRGLLSESFKLKYHKDNANEAIDLSSPFTPITGETVDGVRLGVAVNSVMRKAYDYCITRGMTHKQIDEYKVSIKPYEGRAYFPYWNGSGETVFWMGRALGSQIPKTVEKRGSEKPLFGRHVKRIRNGPVVLVEGVFDHFVTPHSYSIMGSSITRLQISALLEDKISKVFCIADPDAGGAMQNIASDLADSHLEAYQVQLIGSSADPAELGRETMSKLVEELLNKKLDRPQILRIGVGNWA